jgi:hypothetical protein
MDLTQTVGSSMQQEAVILVDHHHHHHLPMSLSGSSDGPASEENSSSSLWNPSTPTPGSYNYDVTTSTSRRHQHQHQASQEVPTVRIPNSSPSVSALASHATEVMQTPVQFYRRSCFNTNTAVERSDGKIDSQIDGDGATTTPDPFVILDLPQLCNPHDQRYRQDQEHEDHHQHHDQMIRSLSVLDLDRERRVRREELTKKKTETCCSIIDALNDVGNKNNKIGNTVNTTTSSSSSSSSSPSSTCSTSSSSSSTNEVGRGPASHKRRRMTIICHQHHQQHYHQNQNQINGKNNSNLNNHKNGSLVSSSTTKAMTGQDLTYLDNGPSSSSKAVANVLNRHYQQHQQPTSSDQYYKEVGRHQRKDMLMPSLRDDDDDEDEYVCNLSQTFNYNPKMTMVMTTTAAAAAAAAAATTTMTEPKFIGWPWSQQSSRSSWTELLPPKTTVEGEGFTDVDNHSTDSKCGKRKASVFDTSSFSSSSFASLSLFTLRDNKHDVDGNNSNDMDPPVRKTSSPLHFYHGTRQQQQQQFLHSNVESPSTTETKLCLGTACDDEKKNKTECNLRPRRHQSIEAANLEDEFDRFLNLSSISSLSVPSLTTASIKTATRYDATTDDDDDGIETSISLEIEASGGTISYGISRYPQYITSSMIHSPNLPVLPPPVNAAGILDNSIAGQQGSPPCISALYPCMKTLQ